MFTAYKRRALAAIISAIAIFTLSACKTNQPADTSDEQAVQVIAQETEEITSVAVPETPIPTQTESPTATPAPTATAEPTPLPTPATPTPLPAGESGSIGGLFFRVTGTHLDDGEHSESEIWRPKENHYFLFVDLEVRNDKTVDHVLSSLVAFRIEDRQGRTWGVTLGDDINSFFDVTLEPGQTVSGVAAFELPNSVRENLTLIVKPDLIARSMLYFDLNSFSHTDVYGADAQSALNETTPTPSETPHPEDQLNTPTPTQSASPSSSLHVGDSIYGESWLFRVLETRIDSEGSTFFVPPDECVFYVVKLYAQNVASYPQDITSLLAFQLMDEDDNYYKTTVNPTSENSLDGRVESGNSLIGDVTFIVPKGISKFKLIIRPDLLEPKSISIDLG